ncbi:UNVERIFIED_CONTAM: hypothetical protein Sradi_6434800 [Sesamum radiatum]|uniref:Reverse transcriptase Ty1/copia-type domain-containing protein n=1 Tax=Sesamum radiatum TaxID=300843 RepID=A0AAW2K3L7_SESRA
MVRFMISFTELPPSFGSYALETATKLLNMATSKTVSQRPYEIWHDKPASYKYLRVWGSPAYVKRLVGDKLHSRSISTNSVPVLYRSTRESRPPDRYGFLRAMSDIDSDKWLEAMRSEMHSIGSNQVLSLVDPPKGVKPIGSMAKSIRILLAIVAWYDYEIWQMDGKMAFLNGFVEEGSTWISQMVSLLLEWNRRSTISKVPSMTSNKLPEDGTHVLMKLYGVMSSSRTSTILVYT